MRQRNIVFVIVISIITFGIYDIYWAFSTRQELIKKNQDVPSPWIVFAPLLALLLVAIMQIIVHLAWPGGPRPEAATILNVVSVIVGVLSIVGIIPMAVYWTWKYCKAVENVTHGALTTGFNFALAILLNIFGAGVIWPAIVQYQYNKLPLS